MALADLLQFNPSANVNAAVAPGTSLTRPCYTGAVAPTYLGEQLELRVHSEHMLELFSTCWKARVEAREDT